MTEDQQAEVFRLLQDIKSGMDEMKATLTAMSGRFTRIENRIDHMKRNFAEHLSTYDSEPYEVVLQRGRDAWAEVGRSFTKGH